MKQLYLCINLVSTGYVGSHIAKTRRVKSKFNMYGTLKQVKSPKPKTKKSKLFGKVKEKEKSTSSFDIHTNLYSLKSTKLQYGRKFVPVKIIGKIHFVIF